MITRLPARLKTENDSGGWLGRVRPAIGVQRSKSEVRTLVHETSVFGAQREVPTQGIISACSVQEGAFSLSAGSGKRCSNVAPGIKDQTAASGERIRTDPANAHWKAQNHIACHCVYVGLNSGFSETTKTLLRVSVETIIALGREPTVKVITVPDCESAGVSGSLRVSLAAGVPRVEAVALHADL